MLTLTMVDDFPSGRGKVMLSFTFLRLSRYERSILTCAVYPARPNPPVVPVWAKHRVQDLLLFQPEVDRATSLTPVSQREFGFEPPGPASGDHRSRIFVVFFPDGGVLVEWSFFLGKRSLLQTMKKYSIAFSVN